MYRADLCRFCGTCLLECQWIKVDKKQAIDWRRAMNMGEYTPVVDACITCYACKEYCPHGADPCDLNLKLQEEHRTHEQKELAAASESLHLFDGELKNLPESNRILAACSYKKSNPEFFEGELFDLPTVSGKPFYCWATFPHMRAKSLQEDHLRSFVDRLASTGAKEVICFHADCYSALAAIAPDLGIQIPFRPVQLVEYLTEYLKQHSNRVIPLDINIAYQRPCTARYTSDKEYWIDLFFAQVGVKRVQREYDRENAICCTSLSLLHNTLEEPKLYREKNFADAQEAGAKMMIYLCPLCGDMLQDVSVEYEMPLVFIGDLARAAIGEINLAL